MAETALDFNLFLDPDGRIELDQWNNQLSREELAELSNNIRANISRFWVFRWWYLALPIQVRSRVWQGYGLAIWASGNVTTEGYIHVAEYYWSPSSGVSKRELPFWIVDMISHKIVETAPSLDNLTDE